jgi:hypothetical protein
VFAWLSVTRDASPDMSGKQLETSAVKRSARSGDLGEDVHAIAVFIDHFLALKSFAG